MLKLTQNSKGKFFTLLILGGFLLGIAPFGCASNPSVTQDMPSSPGAVTANNLPGAINAPGALNEAAPTSPVGVASPNIDPAPEIDPSLKKKTASSLSTDSPLVSQNLHEVFPTGYCQGTQALACGGVWRPVTYPGSAVNKGKLFLKGRVKVPSALDSNAPAKLLFVKLQEGQNTFACDGEDLPDQNAPYQIVTADSYDNFSFEWPPIKPGNGVVVFWIKDKNLEVKDYSDILLNPQALEYLVTFSYGEPLEIKFAIPCK